MLTNYYMRHPTGFVVAGHKYQEGHVQSSAQTLIVVNIGIHKLVISLTYRPT